MKHHEYQTHIEWTGNNGTGTDHYTHYDRNYTIDIADKAQILGSSDPAFRGNKNRHNPEDMFVASVSSCHMLWYLHFCSTEGVTVTAYHDNAKGIMTEEKTGKGQFIQITLYPKVTVQDSSMIEKAIQLHHKANEYCFIANSLNFKIEHCPEVIALNQ